MPDTYARKRILEPHFYYQTPSHVLADRKLCQRAKLKVLQTMRLDARLLADATSMTATSRKTTILESVESAISDLQKAIKS